MEIFMQSRLSPEIERRYSLGVRNVNRIVQDALSIVGGQRRPKAEADARLRSACEMEFRDRNRAHKFCDDVDKALVRRHGNNAYIPETISEFQRQFRRHLWLDAERRQDEMVAQLTSKQVNLVGGTHFSQPVAGNERIGWAISNRGPGDILVDGNGCAVQRFTMAPTYDGGSVTPQLFDGQPFTAQSKVRNNPGASFSDVLLRALIRKSEGDVPYMYLDSAGIVTVGIGHAFQSEVDAIALPFKELMPGSDTMLQNQIANDAHVRNAYNAVTNSNTVGANAYSDKVRLLTKLRLEQTQVEVEFMNDVDAVVKHVSGSKGFPKFTTFPPDVRYAIIDMGFNLGKSRFPGDYPNFTVAVNRRDWRVAAVQSKRLVRDVNGKLFEPKGIAARNLATRKLFEKTATAEPFFHDPSCATKRRLDEWYVPGFFGN